MSANRCTDLHHVEQSKLEESEFMLYDSQISAHDKDRSKQRISRFLRGEV